MTGDAIPRVLRGRHRHPPAPALVVAVLAVLSAPAAARGPVILDPGTRERAFRERGVDPVSRPDPLAVTPEMTRFARQAAGPGDAVERLQRLQRALFDGRTFPFDYDPFITATAAEAFRRHRGNCVSFTNLFLALGRSLGIPVHAATIRVGREERREGDLVAVNNHAIAVYGGGGRLVLFDFNRGRRGLPTGFEIRDDLWVNAIYLNNRGVEELLAGRAAEAERLVRDATRLAPDFADAWSNLGVIRRRRGDVEGAFDAYLLALQLEPRNRAVRRNIAVLYGMTALQNAAAGGRGAGKNNVAGRLVRRGDAAMAAGRVSSARRLYRRAHQLEPERPEPLVAVARVKLYRGKLEAARRVLERVLHMDPGNRAAREILDGMERIRSE